MFTSTKIIELGSCAFRQPRAESHCRFLHGYRLTAKFWFLAKELDNNNWVVDFGGLKELKEILHHYFDHTTCISSDDPNLDDFKRLDDADVCDLRVMDGVGIEKFAEFCHRLADEHVREITNDRCSCTKVEVFEHENNSAIYNKYETQRMSFSGDRDDHVKLTETVTPDEDPFQVEEQKPIEVVKEDEFSVPKTNSKKPAPLSCERSKSWVNKQSTNSWGL